MKVLFAVSNEEISESIVKKYQKEYKQIISYKNVYYFNAILKEIQKDKTYDRIVISEDLEAFTHTQYDQIDKFLFEKLDSISDEASNIRGNDTPIILICSDRRTKSEELLLKIFGIGVYNAIIGNDRSVDEVCKLINRPRGKKEAKDYYKIDSEKAGYQAENENDVSEMEVQNILAHYKRLGKNEDRYVDSFNNIAAQYNDTQLRIISKVLPLNVRAVLEERSPKYQQIMSFNNSISDSIRKKEKDDGPTEKLLTTKNKEMIMTKPVVIPSSLNMSSGKKVTKPKPVVAHTEMTTQQTKIIEQQRNTQQEKNIEEQRYAEQIKEIESQVNVEQQKTTEQPKIEIEVEQVEKPKRGRGRPKKDPNPNDIEVDTPKRKRGRPKKQVNDIQPEISSDDDISDNVLPGFEDIENETYTPSDNFNDDENEEAVLPGFEEKEEDSLNNVSNSDVLPGFEEEEDTFSNTSNSDVLPGFEDNNDDYDNYKNETIQSNNYNLYENEHKTIDTYNTNSSYTSNFEKNNVTRPKVRPYNSTFDISTILTPDKKIVTFVGTSKNGTSFLVNNVAELMSSMGVNTAILDATKNKNSYYIYTRNEEELRRIATKSIQGLVQGNAHGIEVNRNLTVYTSLPGEDGDLENVDEILKTLVNKHSLILIDTDFNTSMGYFKQSQETYLVQTLDILTIQPLTAFLNELKSKNILEESKLRIILNKYIKLRGITEKTIIGGMAFYNEPAMSYMAELFDRNMIKYVTMPLEEETYVKYLEGIINCEISLKGYSKMFMQTLKELGSMIYPIGDTKTTYRPPTIYNNNASGFSPSINNTLDQMKNRY